MTVIYPINGRNERMGSLFTTPKHLLLYEGVELITRSISTIISRYKNADVIILTNESYFDQLNQLLANTANIAIRLIERTSSQVETLRKITEELAGPVMFVDCDIVPTVITNFDEIYPTVFTFQNTTELLNYSNFKVDRYGTILDCNEKQKIYKNAGAGIYYFPDVKVFNSYSINCKSVSECIKLMVQSGVRSKVNSDSIINRFGTLQDIYIDNFSFRQPNAVNLSTGFTDNKVYREKQTVVKIGSTVLFENDWYINYENKKNIPNILSCSNSKLVMEYIERDSDINLDDIFELIDTYKTYKTLNELSFQSYIDNIANHLSKNKLITNGQVLLESLKQLNLPRTFSHGDLSVMNIIPTKLGLKLIDPLYSKNKFGSYELDIAKLCFSFKFYKNDSASFTYIKHKSNIKYLATLVAAESVRVSSYKKEYSFIAENLIKELEN